MLLDNSGDGTLGKLVIGHPKYFPKHVGLV